MKLGGLQETSLLDYPGKISAIVWTVGCNFRCPFCYNTNMVNEQSEILPIDHVLNFLEERKGKLDALSITGGEPLIHKDLGAFIKKVKRKGFLVKVDTNGSLPNHLLALLDDHLIDYVSMDVKAPLEKYELLAGVHVNTDFVMQSVKMIMDKAPDYEFKTTMIPGLLEKKDVTNIASLIKGAKRYYLQQWKMDVPILNDVLRDKITPFSKKDFLEMKQLASPFVESCNIRGVD